MEFVQQDAAVPDTPRVDPRCSWDTSDVHTVPRLSSEPRKKRVENDGEKLYDRGPGSRAAMAHDREGRGQDFPELDHGTA